jgi:hypothetical protein
MHKVSDEITYSPTVGRYTLQYTVNMCLITYINVFALPIMHISSSLVYAIVQYLNIDNSLKVVPPSPKHILKQEGT